MLTHFNMDDSLVILFVGISVAFGKLRTTNLREDAGQRDRIVFDCGLAAIETQSKISCANQCCMTDRCKSVFYKSDSKQCVLHEFLGGYLKLHPSITTPSPGWKYYEREEGLGMFTRSERCLSNGFEYDPAEDICYIIRTMVIDFDLIKQQCAYLNSSLIKITSQEKHDWIVKELASNTLEWICIQGNNDNKVEYQFDDGTSMTYLNWDNGQPNGRNEHYLMMRRSANYKWHDVSKAYFGSQCVIVCEK